MVPKIRKELFVKNCCSSFKVFLRITLISCITLIGKIFGSDCYVLIFASKPVCCFALRGFIFFLVDSMPKDFEQYYGLTKFSLGLNELETDERSYLPQTDTRFRPDQRYIFTKFISMITYVQNLQPFSSLVLTLEIGL